jgi:hypothetical protein
VGFDHSKGLLQAEAAGLLDDLYRVLEVAAGAPGAPAMFDHFSFSGSGLETYLARLKARNVAYCAVAVPATAFVQVQLRDPNGILVEVTFDGEPLAVHEMRPTAV